MGEVIIVECKNCHGGANGEQAACMADIASIVENGNIAFMLYSQHVMDKIDTLECKYEIGVSYAGINNDIPIGLWLSQGKFYNKKRKLQIVK